jgi:L-seryl-tRNA(Ser) seleniumtransferase
MSEVGSGAMAAEQLPSAGLRITARTSDTHIDEVAARFRALPQPVVGHVRKDAFWLDLRCLDNDLALVGQLQAHAGERGSRE